MHGNMREHMCVNSHTGMRMDICAVICTGPAECCLKCQATTGCKYCTHRHHTFLPRIPTTHPRHVRMAGGRYWTQSKDSSRCWVKSAAQGYQSQSNRYVQSNVQSHEPSNVLLGTLLNRGLCPVIRRTFDQILREVLHGVSTRVFH